MKIKWWGHASFSIRNSNGSVIVTDPYNEDLPYAKINEEADFVTVSHEHFDHNAVDLLSGNPKTIKEVTGFQNNEIKIEGIEVYHDDVQGEIRGKNIIFNFEFDGIKISHLGDLGHLLDKEQIEKLADVDILLIPVGGNYTINAAQAYETINKITPKIIFPMHYKTDILDFPIQGIDKFLAFFHDESIEKINGCEIEIDDFPSKQKVYLLNYAK